MRRLPPYAALLTALVLITIVAAPVVAAESPPDSVVAVKLRDSNTIKGTIVSESDDAITLETPAGLRMEITRDMIVSIDPLRDRVVGGRIRPSDPNYTRLMFAPTGRPLGRGSGYFSDYWVFFPGISYGVTNSISFMAGFSIIPGLGLTEQMKYIAPRYGRQFGDNLALSTGLLYMSVIDEFGAGIAFAVGTIGPPEKSLTAGLGLGFLKGENEGFRFSEHPILVLGGNLNLTDNLALISENWIIQGTEISNLPFGVALRIFGQRLSADVGFILIGEILSEGFPIPWLSFVYNFGGGR